MAHRTFDPVGAFQGARQSALNIQATEQGIARESAAAPIRNQLADLKLEQAKVGAQRSETQFGQQQAIQRATLLGQTASALKGISIDQRDAAFATLSPQLEQFGIDVTQFPPGSFTDANLDNAIAQAKAFMQSPQKQTAGQQEFNALVAIAQDLNATPLERNSANRALGNLAKVSSSAAERIAGDPDLAGNIASSQAIIEGAKAGSKETSKLLAKLKLEPQVKAAVADALSNVKILADEAIKTRSNKDVFSIYEIGMGAVADALGDTSTGFFVGRIPSITASQQIADGAIAAIAPVLKQLFRSAGEGIFTDKDQELLLAMIPTRKTTPEAIASILANVDAIVKAKLGITDKQQTGQQNNQVFNFDAQGNLIQ